MYKKDFSYMPIFSYKRISKTEYKPVTHEIPYKKLKNTKKRRK
jgi:hypothetical protein